jgi:hypothetical protein
MQQNQTQDYLNQLSNVLGMDIAQRQWGQGFDADQIQQQYANLANAVGMDISQGQWSQGFGLDKQNQLFNQWKDTNLMNQQGGQDYLNWVNAMAGQYNNNLNMALQMSQLWGFPVNPASTGSGYFNQVQGQNTQPWVEMMLNNTMDQLRLKQSGSSGGSGGGGGGSGSGSPWDAASATERINQASNDLYATIQQKRDNEGWTLNQSLAYLRQNAGKLGILSFPQAKQIVGVVYAGAGGDPEKDVPQMTPNANGWADYFIKQGMSGGNSPGFPY